MTLPEFKRAAALKLLEKCHIRAPTSRSNKRRLGAAESMAEFHAVAMMEKAGRCRFCCMMEKADQKTSVKLTMSSFALSETLRVFWTEIRVVKMAPFLAGPEICFHFRLLVVVRVSVLAHAGESVSCIVPSSSAEECNCPCVEKDSATWIDACC